MNLQLLRSEEEFVALREEWNALAQQAATRSVFLSWEWQHLWWRHFGSGAQLCLVGARDAGGRLRGLAPLQQRQGADGRAALRLLGDNDISDYLDLLVRPEDAAAFAEALLPYLLRELGGWQTLELGCLPEGASARRLLGQAGRSEGLKGDEAVETTSPMLSLPESWEEYLAALPSKTRHELRRKLRKAEREGRASLRLIREPAEMPQALDTFFLLMQRSRPDKAAFLNERMQRFFREAALTLCERGWLELVELHSGSLPVASLYVFDFAGTLHLYNSGFEPALTSLSPGLVVIAYHLRSGIERGRTGYDFMRGDEEYKYRFGATDTPLYRVCLERLGNPSP
ncbi:MAG: GNAT family N-acetyltransferase [Candidatus Tectomicrobia bacterium]|nr:GNAT family N-acetyltransferase [Candidatus Tectomicrobia bacterium]